MAWTTPKTDFANGDVLTATQMNNIGNDLAFIYDNYDAAGKNRILNGDMGIWQRSTSFTNISVDGTYTCDRYFVTRGGNIDVTRRELGTYNPPSGFRYYAEVVNQTASNSFMGFQQAIETANTLPLTNTTVTISAYLRAHANTAASKSVSVRLISSTSNDTKTGGSELINQTVTLNYGTASTDWTRVSFSAAVPSTSRTLRIAFIQSSLAVGDGFHVTGVQLEAGDSVTPFATATGNAASELAACQRYYYRANAGAASTYFGNGSGISTTVADFIVPAPVTLRVAPTAIDYASLSIDDGVTAYTTGTWTTSASTYSANAIQVRYTHGTAALTQFRPYRIGVSASTGYVGFSAEL